MSQPLVLSIDDDESFSKMMEAVLTRFGLQIRSVTSPEEFMEQARLLKPNLYLIDLQLKNGSSGTNLIQAIRKGMAPNASIIVISGSKDTKSIASALEEGANDYILKPLDRALLATKLSQFIETTEIQKQKSKDISLEGRQLDVRLHLNGVIDEVDELGVKFTSSTLIPKGTVLKLGSDLFEQIGVKGKEYLVTVVSTWLIPETHCYGTYAEFDGVDTDFLQAIRRWLTP